MFTESVRIGCTFPACHGESVKYHLIFDMFDISPAHPGSVSGHWLRQPGNRPIMNIYGLSVTHLILLYTVTVLS